MQLKLILFNKLKHLLLIGLLTILSACSTKEEEGASQTLVRVNGEDITVPQLNEQLQRANIRKEQLDTANKQLLQLLIDQQLLEQAAQKDKLDRSIEVLQKIESAKLQILAQAYLENKVAQAGKPTDSEIAKFRTGHADIFANRKVYVLDEIELPPNTNPEILKVVAEEKSNEETVKLLDKQKIKYRRSQTARAAEALPQAVLTQLSKMAVGEVIRIRLPEGIVIGQIVDIKNAPISENDSKPFIERILVAEKRKAITESAVKNLRGAAKIEYLDKKYETQANNQPVKPYASDKSAANATAQPGVDSPSNDHKNAESNEPSSYHLNKGLSGL